MTRRDSWRAIAVLTLVYLITILWLLSRPGCHPVGTVSCWP